MASLSSYYAYVGGRTSENSGAHGNGINVYQVDAATGRWTHVQNVADVAANPGFLAFDSSQSFLYAGHADVGDVTAMSIDAATGKLQVLGSQPTGGKSPVHLCVDPTDQFVVTANNLDSKIVLLPRHKDGSIGTPVDTFVVEGELGPHRTQQTCAKPHQVAFDRSGQYLIVPDKGCDSVSTYRIDYENKKIVHVATTSAPECSGPRHVAVHPTNQWAYVIDELGSSVLSCRFDPANGAIEAFQAVPSIPDSFVAHNYPSEIEVSSDGRFIYGSNRGSESIVRYKIDQKTGRLTDPAWASSGGISPRFFSIDPTQQFVFCANEVTDNIVKFTIDPDDGTLSPTSDVVSVGSPTCMVFKTI